ncbi:M67 family metallopeptidase, partial [Ferrovibrio sp.]|uniref:M67 family metallopeptidase n=1 Tax=Ferrovibrio sp. TaxID=1917215 RepID=UPI00311FF36D
MLVLAAAQAAGLDALAAAAFPDEACALLVGTVREQDGPGGSLVEVRRIVPAANVAADRRTGFEIDPATHIALLRDLRERNAAERIVGHWHSHPNGRAEPSATDVAMIHDPGLVWVISAVDAAGRPPGRRAGRPRRGGRRGVLARAR